MKRLLCLAVFLFFIISVEGAFCCDLIKNWTTQDVQAFATDLRLRSDSTVVSNDPLLRDRDQNVSTLLIVKGFRDKDVNGDTYTWDISISIRSYSDISTADDEFSRFAPPSNSNNVPIIHTQDPLTYYYGPVNGLINNFELHGRHLNSVIHIHASQWAPPGGDRVVTPAEFNDLFLALFARAQGLIDGKCSVSGPGNPPTISVQVDQKLAGKYAFEFSILEMRGFWLVIEDQDGVYDGQTWKIDWGSLRVESDGIDVTGRFVSGAASCMTDAQQTATKVSVLIKPDPTRFMKDQNMFGIAVNGEHRITFKVCDTDGQCGYAEYLVYVGPVIRFEGDSLSNITAKVGNLGYDTSAKWFIVSIDSQGNARSYKINTLTWEEGIVPTAPDLVKFGSGMYADTPGLARNAWGTLAGLGLKYLDMAFLDLDTGEFGYDRLDRTD